MVFNSLQFFIFFPIAVLFYFLLPQKWRNIFLLLASCYFYMAFVPKYVLVLGAVIAVDYFSALAMQRAEGRRKRAWLWLGIAANLGILLFFKYFNFFSANVSGLADFLHWNYPLRFLEIALPIGLSFHTFQSLSYLVEVYKGRQTAEGDFIKVAIYVMFFPQLVAGPIERPQHLLPQFSEEYKFEFRRVSDGLKLMAWGFFKKVVIADRLAVLVNTVYANPRDFYGLELAAAVFFFTFQLYCDFSGYTDIARGSAKVLGFKLVENFNRPFFSKSIAEFWRRWHISLSNWFRDYVYYPIAFSGRRGPAKIYMAIMVTFLLMGVWHGAGWNFVLMGMLFGFYISASFLTKNLRSKAVNLIGLQKIPRLYSLLQVITTFVLVSIACIAFKVNNLGDFWYVTTRMFIGLGQAWPGLVGGSFLENLNLTPQAFALSLGLVVFLVLTELSQRSGEIIPRLNRRPVWLRWGVYYLFLLALLFLSVSTGKQFVYFQF